MSPSDYLYTPHSTCIHAHSNTLSVLTKCRRLQAGSLEAVRCHRRACGGAWLWVLPVRASGWHQGLPAAACQPAIAAGTAAWVAGMAGPGCVGCSATFELGAQRLDACGRCAIAPIAALAPCVVTARLTRAIRAAIRSMHVSRVVTGVTAATACSAILSTNMYWHSISWFALKFDDLAD